jgi:multiple sugar transport system permease protein
MTRGGLVSQETTVRATTAVAAVPFLTGRRRAFLDSEVWLGRLMLAPAILYIVLLVGFPFLLALYYSLSDITIGTREMNFVGLKQFEGVITTRAFQQSLKNTLVFTFVSQAVVLVLAKVLALALLKDFRGKWMVRLLILLPWVAPISLGTIGWLWILDSIYSVINWTLQALGLISPASWPMWLGIPHLAMGSVITVHVWRLLPLATVILLAGLTSIPKDIHDAAAVDGAGFWRHHFQITLPLVRPIMLVALLFGVVFAFTDMVVIFVLTRGGPYDTTQVLASLAFFTGIQGGDLAEGAAIALFLFPLLVAAAIALLRVARRAEVT